MLHSDGSDIFFGFWIRTGLDVSLLDLMDLHLVRNMGYGYRRFGCLNASMTSLQYTLAHCFARFEFISFATAIHTLLILVWIPVFHLILGFKKS